VTTSNGIPIGPPFSPRNLAIGLGIVAGVVAFLVSRRRSGRPRED